MQQDRTVPLGVVILAAGHSSRMGRPKLLLPWGKSTILGHLVDQWTRLGAAQIAVVRQSQDTVIQVELDRLMFSAADRIANPDPDRGMFSSIQCAANWTGWQPNLTHFAVALGDQPHVGLTTLKKLLQFTRQHADHICQPGRGGHARHPVLLPRNHYEDLARSTAPNLKKFLASRSNEVRLLEFNDPALDLDLDRPEDYERAVSLFLKKERGAT